MTYLIGQIFVFLLIALILGLIIGWMLRGSAAKQREAFLEEDLRVSQGRLGDTEAEYRRNKSRLDEVESERSEVSKRCVSLERSTVEQADELEQCRAEIVELNNSLNGKEQRVMVLEKESRYWQKQVPLLQNQLNKSESTIRSLQKSMNLSEEEIPELQSLVDAKVQQLDSANEELETTRREFADLRMQVQNSDKKVREADLLLASQKSKTESALQAKSNLEAELERVRNTAAPSQTEAANEQALADKQKRIDELQAALAECQTQQQQAQQELRKELETLRAATVDAQSHDTTSPEPALAAIPEDDGKATEDKVFSARPDRVDDLKRIKGVGPKLEGMLNNMGIYQFDQIAGFTLKDLNWVDDKLTAFKGRAQRDNWVAQASKLAQN